jgi:hypothetical protein
VTIILYTKNGCNKLPARMVFTGSINPHGHIATIVGSGYFGITEQLTVKLTWKVILEGQNIIGLYKIYIWQGSRYEKHLDYIWLKIINYYTEPVIEGITNNQCFHLSADFREFIYIRGNSMIYLLLFYCCIPYTRPTMLYSKMQDFHLLYPSNV